MNEYDRKAVDALLTTAYSRMLNAGYMLNQMRELHRQGRDIEYWRVAIELGEHLTVGGHAIGEAHRLMMAGVSMFVPPKGELPN